MLHQQSVWRACCRVVVLGALPLLAAGTLEAQERPRDLFRAVADAKPPSGISLQRADGSHRVVTADVSIFARDAAPATRTAPLRVRLDLFPERGESFVASLSHPIQPPVRGEAWTGTLEGAPLSSVALVVDSAAGLVTGSVTAPDGVYQIRPQANGQHVIVKIDPSQLPPELPPLQPAAEARMLADSAPIASDSATRIDVMVVYTPAARAAVWGETQIRNLIALAVTETNQSYANSGILHRLRLVHASEIAYSEAPSMQTDLVRLQATSDGYMDGVHALRNQYGADLVGLITVPTDACGVGYLNTASATSAPWAFQVTAWNCATGNYTFGHEFGHNLGAHHDWFVAPHSNSALYNRGYYPPGKEWRTVMAYSNGCSGCPRVQYWSNPEITHPGTGLAMGRPVGSFQPTDNRRTLNEMAPYAANFRAEVPVIPASATTNAPSGRISSNVPTYSWNKVEAATWYQLLVQPSGAGTSVVTAWYTSEQVCDSTTCAVAPTTALTYGQAYDWWIQTWNSAGAGALSTTRSFTPTLAPPAAASLTAPASTVVTARPTYAWNAVAASTWYYLWVSSGGVPVIKTWYASGEVCGASGCSVTPAVDLPVGAHTAWVQTWNAGGAGPWSAPRGFTRAAAAPPPATTTIAPAGDVASATPAYSWNAVGTATWYYLWVTDAHGHAVLKTWYPASTVCRTTTCSVTPTVSLPAAKYTWWVQTWNEAGDGPWTAATTFTRLPGSPPVATTLISPVNVSVTAASPPFAWTKVAPSTWYYLWVQSDNGTVTKTWYQAVDVCGTDTCSVTAATPLAAGTHTWWVQTWNATGEGPWSASATFTTR